MTREEAKELLLHILMTYEPKDQYGDYDDPEPYEQALTMAIEALSADTVSREAYHNLVTASNDIDRALREYQDKEENGELVSVVRCKDCKHKYVSGNGTTQFYVCDFMDAQYEDNGFCHHGERKGGGTE